MHSAQGTVKEREAGLAKARKVAAAAEEAREAAVARVGKVRQQQEAAAAKWAAEDARNKARCAHVDHGCVGLHCGTSRSRCFKCVGRVL